MTPSYSDLMKNIRDGKFVFTGELEPEKTTDLTELIEGARKLLGQCVACNVTDNPQSMAYMSSLVASYIVQRDSGMECVYQLRCSDRNSIALTSDLLGAGALGIRNVLALTGDHTALGDYPGSMPVFDIDSGQLVYLIRRMVDEGVDLNGKPIEHPPKYHVGVAGNPNADPLDSEILKLKRKVDAGAEFVQTQVIFDIEVARTFLKEMEKYKVPVLVGIFPLKNYGTADYFDKYIPGVHVPKDLLANMKEASEIGDKEKKKERYDEINLDYYGDFVHEIAHNTSAAGIHIMAVAYERITPPLIERAKI